MTVLLNIAKIFQRVAAGWIPGGRRQCPFCHRHVHRFIPYRLGKRSLPPLASVLQVIGSDVDNFSCPRCSSHDRERHLLFYLRASGLLDAFSGKRILHFAPERRMQLVIHSATPSVYVKADLYPDGLDIRRVDILNMPFDDGSFDFVIANHVMEHVADDIRALSEIHRVLQPGGHAILQTPFSPKLISTWQDPGIDTNDARLVAFGQEDHVRLYGRDIFDRFESVGFQSLASPHRSILPDLDVDRFGVNVEEPFFLFRKFESIRVSDGIESLPE